MDSKRGDGSEPTITWASSQNKPTTNDHKLDIDFTQGKFQFWEEAEPFTSDDAEDLQSNFTAIEKVERHTDHILLFCRHKTIRVSGRFADLEYMPGMRIKALACPCCSAPSHNPICSVSDTENIILIEDNIISVTSFCTALDCINNPLFKDIIADISFVYSHKSLAVGRVCHKLIESCISKQRKDLPFLISETKKIIQTYPGYLYCCNITAKELLNELLKLFKPINAFLAQRSDHTLAEYSVISLTFSMKGNIDCLEPGTYRNPGSVIEIKTGTRQSVSHRAQLMIYSLLYAEQRSISCKSLGCALYYAKSGETVFAKITHSEIAGLVQLRNRIAATKSVTSCNCSEGTPCHIYNKIKTLPETHFLRRLLAAIEEERSGGRTYIKAVLLGNANKGIQKGAEDKHSIYSYRYPVRIKDAIPENEYMLVFTRSKQFVTRGTVKHDADGSLNICTKDALPLDKIFFVSIDGSSIFYRYMLWSLFYVLYPMYFGLKTCLFKLPGATCNSDENDDIGMTLSSINSEEMSDIESGWLESSHNTDNMVDEQSDSLKGIANDAPTNNLNNIRVNNLDNTSTNNLDTTSNNNLDNTSNNNVNTISSISLSETLLIKRPKIAFNHITVAESSSSEDAQDWPTVFKKDINNLNKDQKDALFKALNCRVYSVIHGMPGTGKSTLIALMLKILAHTGRKTLVICYTHLAINNIIRRIDALPYYRTNQLGEQTESSPEDWTSAPEEFARRISSARTVFGTCFSFNDPVFLENKFDFAIIDEGSQMHFPLAMIPVSISDRFCIVGDHLQLSPLSKSHDIMKLSLFEHLIGGCNVLRLQYRMGSNIMRLSNALFYSGQLICCTDYPGTVDFVDTAQIDFAEHIKTLGECVILCYFNSTVNTVQALTTNTVSTVDKFQGSEADRVCVFFDPVVKCDVVTSRQRLNVALTRARHDLILLGHKEKMYEIPIFKELLEILDWNKWN